MIGFFARRTLLATVLVLVAGAVSGCDKCGHPIHLNAPAIQHACGDDAAQAR